MSDTSVESLVEEGMRYAAMAAASVLIPARGDARDACDSIEEMCAGLLQDDPRRRAAAVVKEAILNVQARFEEHSE